METAAVNPRAVSVSERIKTLSRSTRQDAQVLLRRFALERLIARVTASDWGDRVCLKGGMLMLALSRDGARPTEDVDFKLDMDPGDAADFVRGVCAVGTGQDDGLRFDPSTIVSESIRDGCLPGSRVKMFAFLDAGRRPVEIRVKLDLAWGDAGFHARTVELPPVLPDFGSVHVRSVPVAMIVADKLHAVHRHGAANTRLKDYYDLLLIVRTMRPDADETADAVRAVFDVWGGQPSDDMPGLENHFGEDNERSWRAFVRAKNGLQMEVGTLADAIAEIREFALPVMRLAAPGRGPSAP